MKTVATANGDIQAEDLGICLPHEHLFMNLMLERRGDGLINDEGAVVEELKHFSAQGGSTVFDLTTAELTPGSTVDSTGAFKAAQGQTRNPQNVEAIQRASRETGVNVVLGTGRYRDPFLSEEVVNDLGVDGLAEEMVRDLIEGIPETSARAGLIGEIGADKWFISPLERKVFLAAAKAQKQTDKALYTHATRWRVALEQIDLLNEVGVDPARVAIGHVDTVPQPGFAVEVAKHGVYVGIDTINSPNSYEVTQRVNTVMDLVRAGYLERVLLSHDVCLSSHHRIHGGNGFAFILGGFKEALLAAGLSEAEFDVMTRLNPARLVG